MSATKLLRPITSAERSAYATDGVVILRDVLDDHWVRRMRDAIDRALSAPSKAAMSLGGGVRTGRYLGDFFMWQRDPDFRAIATASPLVILAQQMLDAKRLSFFYDQLLVKEPQTLDETPWHQDLPYWPVRGEDILSIWVPFDDVTAETGAMRYVRGSHLSGTMYAPAPFARNSAYADVYARSGLKPFPDISQILDTADLIVCPVRPGDVIVHHPLTFHWSPGNLHPDRRRRALALRYLGDDVVFDDRPGTLVENPKVASLLYETMRYAAGERLGGANFPQVWPQPAAGTH